MKETPVNKIMENTLEKMREMVDVSTIIGDPMVTGPPSSRIKSCSAVAAAVASPLPRWLLS